MSIVTIIILILGFVALGALFLTSQKKHQIEFDSVQSCLAQLHQLKALLISIQQHRGLTVGYLHGDKSLKIKIQTISTKINGQWEKLERDFPGITSESLFVGISSHWGRLGERWKNQTITNNIEQHNRLITNLLYLIENQAESNLSLVKFARTNGLDVIWRELLETIEAIGQTRAIGMGVVGAGTSTAVERIQLKFLMEKMTSRLLHLELALTKGSQNRNETAWVVPHISLAKSKADYLIEFINGIISENNTSHVTSDAFFSLATSAIEPLEKLFGEAANYMQSNCAKV